MSSKKKLQVVGEEALKIMQQSLWAAESFGNVRLVEVEEKIKVLANKNGFRFEDVEKEAQRISLLVK